MKVRNYPEFYGIILLKNKFRKYRAELHRSDEISGSAMIDKELYSRSFFLYNSADNWLRKRIIVESLNNNGRTYIRDSDVLRNTFN